MAYVYLNTHRMCQNFNRMAYIAYVETRYYDDRKLKYLNVKHSN